MTESERRTLERLYSRLMSVAGFLQSRPGQWTDWQGLSSELSDVAGVLNRMLLDDERRAKSNREHSA